MLEDHTAGSGGTEAGHADALAGQSDVALPAEGGECLYGYTAGNGGGKHLLPVLCRLVVEEIHTGHADNPNIHALGQKCLSCFHCKLNLGTGSNDDGVRCVLCTVFQDVGTLQGFLGGAFQLGKILTGKHQCGGCGLAGRCKIPCSRSFHGIRRPEGIEVGHRTEHGQLLDGLMGGPVFPDTDAVMRKYISERNLHQSGKPRHGFYVVTEYKEGGNKRAKTAVKPDAVSDGSHSQFSDTEVQVASFRSLL